MDEKRTLIETFLPVEEISAEAKKEKNGRAPTFELHYWWTRKPLVAARATVLSALLPEDYNVKDFKRLLGLKDNQKTRAHNYDLSKSQIDSLKKNYIEVWGTDNPTILDPFGGGGSIPFEAVRMGCNIISNDYNPVAYIIQKATIEYPAKYGDKLLKDVKIGLEFIYNRAKEELGNYYPKHDSKDVAAYIYAWVASCPNCGFKNPLVGQWWLVRKGKKNLFLDYEIEDNKISFKIKSGNNVPQGNVIGGKGKCLNCGTIIPNSHILEEINKNEEEILLAVVLLGEKGKEYALPNDEDLKAISKVKKILKDNWDTYLKEDLISLEEMPLGDIRSAKYLKYWHRIYNPRQKLFSITLIKLIRKYIDNLNFEEEYKTAIATYLALVLGKNADFNCRFNKYVRTYEIISSTTASIIPGMMWDHTEVNPFVKSSGTLVSIQRSILRSLEYSIQKLNSDHQIQIYNKSIIESNFKAQIIVTDPPYFDDVIYPELSEFFYVQEKRALKFLNLPKEIPKADDLSVGKRRSKEVFENLFNISCKKMNSMLTDEGILVMYFAHSSVKAWDFVVSALQNANFRITATWPIHTERASNPLAMGHSSIMSSIIIVARKRKEEKFGFIEEIKEDLEIYLKKRLQEFWDYGLRGADITVSAMGASLDILTQYSEIKSYSGEMSVIDILELVEVYVVEYILEKFLKNSESFDSSTRFYVYCRLSELEGMSFDTANLISKSLGIDLKYLETSGLIESIKKGKNKGIKLLKFDERDKNEKRTLIDAVQWSMTAYDLGGMREFESALADIPYSQSEIYNILESFKHLDNGDSEKQIALQILGKSTDSIPKKGQSTLDNIKTN